MTISRILPGGLIALLAAALAFSLWQRESRRPNPSALRQGEYALVSGIGERRLNIRYAPRLNDSPPLFRARLGDKLKILDGPQFSDGYDWWLVHDEAFDVAGWAAGQYLKLSEAESES